MTISVTVTTQGFHTQGFFSLAVTFKLFVDCGRSSATAADLRCLNMSCQHPEVLQNSPGGRGFGGGSRSAEVRFGGEG